MHGLIDLDPELTLPSPSASPPLWLKVIEEAVVSKNAVAGQGNTANFGDGTMGAMAEKTTFKVREK